MFRRDVMLALALAMVVTFPAMAGDEPAPPDDFSDAVAARLLQQVTQGFITNNRGQVLSAFNGARMKDYAQFRENIAALFAQYQSFRAGYRLRQSWPQGERGVVIVDFELEGEPLEEGSPPFRHSAQLRFEFERGTGGWKIVDVAPRSFFS
jgi:hypothetical protein